MESGTTKRGQVTFGRMVPISNLPGDGAGMEILVDGVNRGEIVREMIDIGATSTEYRVSGYVVEIDDADTKAFAVGRLSWTAQEALAAAKAWARATIRLIDSAGAVK